MKSSMSPIIVKDLYEVVQTIIFAVFGVTLIWDALIWLTGDAVAWMSTGFRAPIYALAANMVLCAAFVIVTSLMRRFPRRRFPKEGARPKHGLMLDGYCDLSRRNRSRATSAIRMSNPKQSLRRRVE